MLGGLRPTAGEGAGELVTCGGCCGVPGCCLAGVLGAGDWTAVAAAALLLALLLLAEDEEDDGIADLMASIRLAANRLSWKLACLCFS